MTRRALSKATVGMLALGLPVLVFSHSALAQKGKPPAEGSVSCPISSGTLKLTPQSGSPGTLGVTLRAKIHPPSPCMGSPTLANGDSVTVTGASLKGHGTATSSPTSDDTCDLGTVTVTLRWKSSPKIAPTMLTFQGGTWSPPGPPILPASGGTLESDTGSFGGSGASATITPKSEYPPNPCAGTKPITIHITGGTVALGSPPTS